MKTGIPTGPAHRRTLLVLHVTGLVTAAVGIACRWALGDISPPAVPPGLVALIVAAAVVVARPRPLTMFTGAVAAAAVSAVVILGAGPSETRAAGDVAWGLEVVGLGLAIAAGSAGVLRAVRGEASAGPPADWGQRAQVAGLLVLAPICAEYLAAYDDSTGRPARLLLGLLLYVPLYGCSALLIREAARRAGLGWPGIVLLSTGFALLQAGVVDQSLFRAEYRELDTWNESFRSTLIEPVGISASNVLNFLGGHVIFSICAPIALVEAVRPVDRETPWLSRRWLLVAAVPYGAVSALILVDHLRTQTSHASMGQVAASLVLAGCLGAAALRLPRRGRPLRRAAPRVRIVFLLVLPAAALHGVAPETWTGVGMSLGALVAAGAGIAYGSRLAGWSYRHVAAIAAAPLLVRALLAFLYDPLFGDVDRVAKYGHNAAMLALVLGLTLLAVRRREAQRAEP